MDAQTFDRWTTAFARRPTRRAAARLVAAGVFAGLGAPRLAHAAMQADRDGDGLFDADETDVYGTNPDVFDTDQDGIGDGEEIYNRDQGLPGPNDPLTPAGGGGGGGAPAACAPQGGSCVAANCCTGYCDGETCQCASDGRECRGHAECCNGVCNPNGFCGNCGLLGATCDSAADCCWDNYMVGCCFDGTTLTTRCTDITATGVCPGDPVGPVTCAAGLTNCGGDCVDLNASTFDCGFCGNSCGIGGFCNGGVCAPRGIFCPEGLTACGDNCVDTMNDTQNCGGCGLGCFEPLIGEKTCTNGRCNE
jgi:hypothetical protein